MSLLQSAESRLGPVDSWPSNILKYLFFEPTTLRTIKALISFFYGKCIPCPMAVQLFRVCNDYSYASMTEQFYSLYEEWLKSENEVHLGIYYNMMMNQLVYIHGSRKYQLEIVNDVPKGFGDVYTVALQNKIDHIRAYVPFYQKTEFYSFSHLFCTFIPYRSVMSPLRIVENQISTVFSWPRLILKYLFCEHATSLLTLAIINF